MLECLYLFVSFDCSTPLLLPTLLKSPLKNPTKQIFDFGSWDDKILHWVKRNTLSANHSIEVILSEGNHSVFGRVDTVQFSVGGISSSFSF